MSEQRPPTTIGRPRFYRRSKIGPAVSLAGRIAAGFGLIGVALAGHWFDRDGLRDNVDGEISFIDVLYFTMITVTTVGYGDIVPVTDRARLFDTFVVTPIRIFIWLIFLGSAYSFLLRHGWENWRMGIAQRRLADHTIVCGFGSTGSEAVAELLRRGCPPDAIVVIDCTPEALATAEDLGIGTVIGDATRNAVLEAAGIARARSVIVSPGRDDTAILIALTVRRLAPKISLSVGVRAVENEVLARDAGADVIVNPVSFGGQLLAGSTLGSHIADYIGDLITKDGRVSLRERIVAPDEIGRALRDISSGLGVRIYRAEQPVGFWEVGARALKAGDIIVEIVPNAGAVARP